MKYNIIYLIIILVIFAVMPKNYQHENNNKIANEYDVMIREAGLFYLSQTPKGKPIKNGIITSGYGNRICPFDSSKIEFHKGIDIIPISANDTVYATHVGYVEYVKNQPTEPMGNMVVLESEMYETKYAHLDEIFVKRGERVYRSKPIGICGSTGLTTGKHLHYEVLSNGKNLNPKKFLNTK